MVLEATAIALDEQRAILSKQQAVVDAGVGPSDQDTVMYAAKGAAYSAAVVACLELIAAEPEQHYDIFLTGLNWKSGRAFASPQTSESRWAKSAIALLRHCFGRGTLPA